MADTQVLGTCVFGRVGSSPTSRTLDSALLLPHEREEISILGWL